jgi:DNA-directed RNA polymerase specialized sigma24 family protein
MAALRLDDHASLLLLVFGVGMCVAGALYSGPQDAVASTLILAGVAVAVAGVLLPRLRELEIGPGGLKTSIRDDVDPQPLVDAQVPRLNRFAHLVSGDSEQARELVEDALARTRVQHRRVPPDERAAFTLRTLVELLDTAEERHWLRGKLRTRSGHADVPDPQASGAVIQALQQLDFPARVAFLLRADWSLRLDEISRLLEQPLEIVKDDVARAREVLRPYIESAVGPGRE